MMVDISFYMLAFTLFAILANGFRCRNRLCYFDITEIDSRGSMSFDPRNINPFHCTHIVYFCVAVYNDSVELLDYDQNENHIHLVNEQRNFNPQLKTLMAVNFTCTDVGILLSDKNVLHVFFESLVGYLVHFHFNGTEINYKRSCDNMTESKHNLNSLVKATYDAFHKYHVQYKRPLYIIALTVSAQRSVIDQAYDVEYLSRYVDMFNLETDDFRSGFEDTVGHFSPLYGDYRLDVDISCVDYAVRYWQSKGAPGNKLNIVIGLYGVTYEISLPYMHYIGNKANGPGIPGPYTQHVGYLAYYEICHYLRLGASVFRARDQEVPHLVYCNQWVGYEDEWSVTKKVNYVLRNQLAGVAIWAFDVDDFVGKSCNSYSYPLMNTIHRVCENHTA